MDFLEKAKIRLEHWVEHSDHHIEDYSEFAEQLDQEGLKYTFELCWSNQWQQAVLNCSSRHRPTHIFMPDYQEEKKRSMFSGQQWALLRQASVPVSIVRPGRDGARKVLLAAVNMQKEDDERYARLNEKILSNGMEIARLYGADFHVVNAYQDSLHYPDRDRLLQRTRLPTQKVHVEEGDPAEVIANYADRIGADTVVIGTLARQGAQALMKGNTSEKVLRRVTQDVIAYS